MIDPPERSHSSDPWPTMEGPAIYRIRVQGKLDSERSKYLAGMQITPVGTHGTMLVGRLEDQATLSGVLTALYELHLPVSSVECLEAG